MAAQMIETMESGCESGRWLSAAVGNAKALSTAIAKPSQDFQSVAGACGAGPPRPLCWNPGAMVRTEVGSIRTNIQRPSGGQVAAARER